VFWVISVYFKIRNTLQKSGTFLLGHPVYVCMCMYVGFKTLFYVHNVRHPRCLYNKLYWSVCICLTQLYDGRDMYIIYYIKNNYMFRHFSLAIFRLINEKFRKQLHLTCVVCIQWGGKRWSGNEIWHVV